MKTINMWLESPKKAGQIELTEDEITYNLEDFLNDLINGGFDTFKLYSGVTNSGPIGLIAEVKNGDILEMDIDEYSQIIGEDLDIEDLYNDESDSWAVFDLDENTGDENSNYFETENKARKEYDKLVNKYYSNEDALHTIILLHNGETIDKFNYEDTSIKDACKDTDDVFINDNDYDKTQVKAYKMLIGPKKPFAVIYAYNQGKGKVLLNPPLIKKSNEEVQDFLNGFRRGREGTKVTVDVFYASQIRSIKESLISRELIKDNTTDSVKTNDGKVIDYYNKLDKYFKSKYPGMEWEMERVGYARVYDPKTMKIIKSGIPISSILLLSKDSINDSKGYDIMQLCRKNDWYTRGTREEYDHLLYGVDDGLSAEEAAKDIFYHSRQGVKYSDVLTEVKKIIKDSVKDAKVSGVDDWIIEEAREIVMSGYDDKEDLLDKIQDLSEDLTPRNVLDIYKYLKHTMRGIDSVGNRKYNRYCGQLVTDSLKDVDSNLKTGKSYFKELRTLFRQYLGTDENYGDKWIKKDNNSVIDMYSWVEKQEPAEDYKKNPKKTLKLEQQQFENIIDDICAELGCSWERGYEGTSSGSSSWFHDATDLNNNKEYDDYCIADYRIILPEGITKWEKGNDSTEVNLMLTKDSKKVKDTYSYEELKKMYTGKQHEGKDIYKVNGKYSFNPNTNSDRFETEEDLINSTKTKWQPGDETVLKINTPEYRYMRDVVNKLNELAAPGYTYRLDDVYLDAGQDWVWTTIVQDGGWASVQILNPKQWLDIVNGKPTDEVVKEIRSGEYFHEE